MASIEDYEQLGEIGSGAFGKVVRIRSKATKSILAWKEVYYGRMSEKEKTLLVNEVNILREFRFFNL